MANAAPRGSFSSCFESQGGIKKSTKVFRTLNGQSLEIDRLQGDWVSGHVMKGIDATGYHQDLKQSFSTRSSYD